MSDRSPLPLRAPVPLRAAASLILLRDGARGLEVLVGLRALHLSAFPGMLSFPGGKIEPQDQAQAEASQDPLRAAALAALRETWEETGLRVEGVERLRPFSRWITPPGRPYRFDTWFFLAAASAEEAAAALICSEFETLSWSAPPELLAADLDRLMPPTRGNLEVLARSGTAAQALARASRDGPFVGSP